MPSDFKIYAYVYISYPCLAKVTSWKYERTVEIIGGIILANIKSAKKRILVNRTKAERNKAIKSATKTAIKKVYAAIEAKDKEAAKAALLAATSTIDKAAKKGVYHKNNASRKISRLNLAVNKMA